MTILQLLIPCILCATVNSQILSKYHQYFSFVLTAMKMFPSLSQENVLKVYFIRAHHTIILFSINFGRIWSRDLFKPCFFSSLSVKKQIYPLRELRQPRPQQQQWRKSCHHFPRAHHIQTKPKRHYFRDPPPYFMHCMTSCWSLPQFVVELACMYLIKLLNSITTQLKEHVKNVQSFQAQIRKQCKKASAPK